MSRLTEPIGPDDHVLGRSDAPAILVEYGDYECPFCRQAHAQSADLRRRVGDEMLFSFRHFPLVTIHPEASLAAQAAEAAGGQGRFWEMHDMLFDNQEALGPDDLVEYAAAVGLDVDRFVRELRSGSHGQKVRHDFRTGVRSGVNGTPTFFLDGIRFDRGWDVDTLAAAIDEVASERPEQGIGARLGGTEYLHR